MLMSFKHQIEVRQTMKDCKAIREIKVLGIDLAKQSFQLHGVDKAGYTVLRRKLNRNKLTAFIANLPPCLIGLEACGGAHHWVRIFTNFGHTVRMMAPSVCQAVCQI